jgi:hypothetical protein
MVARRGHGVMRIGSSAALPQLVCEGHHVRVLVGYLFRETSHDHGLDVRAEVKIGPRPIHTYMRVPTTNPAGLNRSSGGALMSPGTPKSRSLT